MPIFFLCVKSSSICTHSGCAMKHGFSPASLNCSASSKKEACPGGVVTTKIERFTLPLLEKLQLAERAACIVSGDTCSNFKPHPEPLLHASREMGIPAGECVYVGDDERDVLAARAAKMQVVVVLYGYLGNG